jgi:hypothetical protein
MQQTNNMNTSGSGFNTQNYEKKIFNTQEKPKDVRRSNIIAAKCK